MLEPLIVLTVLNCIFMFSSTVTTCALWWQHQRHRCCARADVTRHKPDLKKSKSYTFGTVEKAENLKTNNLKSLNGSPKPKDKKGPKRRSKKNLPYLAEYQRRREEKMLSSGAPEARKLEEKTKMSEASQTMNDTKSTVVMEFSTVQKVVQIVDNDSETAPPRISFKDIVIQQKDTAVKKRDRNAEQTFVSNDKNSMVKNL